MLDDSVVPINPPYQSQMSAARPPGPDFLCIGAQKGGTRWLYDQLSGHPLFWMPPVKEFHYFDTTGSTARRAAASRIERRFRKHVDPKSKRNLQRVAKGKSVFAERDRAFVANYAAAMNEPPDLDRYAQLFGAKGEQLAGDVTPGYSTLDDATVSALAARFPWLKVVFLARDPVDRLWSHCCMALRRESSHAPATVDAEAVVKFAGTHWVHARSFPSETVRRWRRFFQHEQFGVFFFDDLKRDPGGLRHRILSFLGIDDEGVETHLAPDFNRKKDYRKIALTDEIRRSLADYFADELARCSDELGGAAREWPARYAPSRTIT